MDPGPLLDAILSAPRGSPPGWVIPRLETMGIASPQETASFIHAGAASLDVSRRDLLSKLIDRAVAGHLVHVPDPGLALRGLVGILEAQAGSTDTVLPPILKEAADTETGLEPLLRLLGQAEACTEPLTRDAQMLSAALGALGLGQVTPPDDTPLEIHHRGIAAALAAAGDAPENRITALARYRRQATLTACAREFVGGASVQETGRDLSLLAAALIEAALPMAAEANDPDGMVVIALGKLGGWELNYSSDVDLVYIHDDRQTNASAADHYQRLARRLGRILEQQTNAGPVYRVDLRLRPEGQLGAMVPGLEAALRYYEARGRTWERQALLKARPVAGDLALGRQLIDALEPFVFGQPLVSEGIAEILKLRRRVRQRADQLQSIDVKEGPGGIRDVESCVQFLQLLHGRDTPSVRTPSTLDGAQRLQEAGILTEDEAQTLTHAYMLQRRIEHALQTERARESWTLPPPGGDRDRLSRRLGFAATAELEDELRQRRQAAADLAGGLLEGLFAPSGRTASTKVTEADADLILQPAPSAEIKQRVLGPHGFSDVEAAHRHLLQLGREESRLLVASPRALTYLAGLTPRLLHAIAKTADPDRTLLDLGRMATTLGAKATYLQLLAENPDALQLFVNLASGSRALVEIVCRRPGIFDEVLDRLQTARFTDPENLGQRLEEIASSAQDPVAALMEARAVHLLLIGIRDVGGRANAANCMSDLATLAEAMLRTMLTLALKNEDCVSDGLAVVAMGRLASGELLYGSDLDVIFVTDAERARLNAADATVRGERIARGLVTLSQTTGTPLLPNPIDPSLRPMGSKGPLVVSLGALRRYHLGHSTPSSRIWERLAFTRARAVSGDQEVGHEVAHVLRHELMGADPPTEVWSEVREMRRRQVAAASPQDLKRGRGGLADIEFLAAALCLTRGHEHPELTAPHTLKRLDAARDAGLLDETEHGHLITTYQLLTRVILRLRLSAGRDVDTLPTDAKATRSLALLLGYADTAGSTAEASLRGELDYHRQQVHACLQSLVARESRG